MKITAYIFSWLELLGLGLWIGGMVTLGALVAPTVFDQVKPVEMAGDTMSLLFRNFNGGLVYGCIGLVLVGFLGKIFLVAKPAKARWVEGSLIAAMVTIGIYLGAVLGPNMQDLRQSRKTDPSNTAAVVDFSRGHRLSERLFTLNLILGLSVLFLNGKELASSGEKKS